MVALGLHAALAMTPSQGLLRPEHWTIVALVALIASGRMPWPTLARMPVVGLLGALCVYLLVQAAYVARDPIAPPFARQLTDAAKLVRIVIGAIVVGVALQAHPRWPIRLFAIALAGWLVTVLAWMPWGALPALWDGSLRVGFGLTENLAGAFSALSLCWLLVLATAPMKLAPAKRALVGLAFGAGYALAFVGMLFSQSRAAWLGAAVVVPATAVLRLLWLRRRRLPMRAALATTAFAAVIMVAIGAAAVPLIQKRVAGVEQLVQGTIRVLDESVALAPDPSPDVSADPPAGTARSDASPPVAAPALHGTARSDSVRRVLFGIGVRHWLEKPLLGWGLRTSPLLIANSGAALQGDRHAHVHNAYLEVLMGLGAVGALLLLALALAFAAALRQGWRAGQLGFDSLLMIAAGLGVMALTNAFDTLCWRFDHARALMALMLGVCLAAALRARAAAAGTQSPAD